MIFSPFSILIVLIVQFKFYYEDIKNYSNILPLIGLYAAIAFRIIPSFTRILVHLNNIKFSKASVDVIFKELKLTAKKNGEPIKDEDAQVICASSCSTNALVFGDRNNHESEVANLK